VATVTPPPKDTNMTEKTLKEKIKFRIQFMLMMWNCGRDEEANKSLKLAMELIDQIEEKEHA
jgi:hypothetical protein